MTGFSNIGKFIAGGATPPAIAPLGSAPDVSISRFNQHSNPYLLRPIGIVRQL